MDDILDVLVAHGVPGATIVRVAQLIADAKLTQDRRTKNAERMKTVRTHVPTSMHTETQVSLLSSSTINNLKVQEERTEIVALASEFAEFYAAYPHKVGKRAAATAFERARRRIPMAEIMAGLARYAAKTDDRPWCNPATWLNQDRCHDQPGPTQEANGKAKPKQQQASVLDFASGFDARTRMQLAERAEIERQRKRP